MVRPGWKDNRDESLAISGAKPRILLLDDDVGSTEALAWALRGLWLDVMSCTTGAAALAAARTTRFDLLLLDLRLPDISGLDLVRTLRIENVGAPFLLLTGFASVSTAVEAMRLGALTVLEKPVDIDAVIEWVRRAVPRLRPARTRLDSMTMGPSRGAASLPRSVAERWALLVRKVVAAERDPKTLADWAAFVGVSRTNLCECCRLVHVAPHDARDFARILRAVCRCGENWEPETVMDLSDVRTLNKLVARAGLTGRLGVATPTPEEFMARQGWISRDNPALLALRRLLAGGTGGTELAR